VQVGSRADTDYWHQTINKRRLNDNNYATTSENISNGLNNYFDTVDDRLVK